MSSETVHEFCLWDECMPCTVFAHPGVLAYPDTSFIPPGRRVIQAGRLAYHDIFTPPMEVSMKMRTMFVGAAAALLLAGCSSMPSISNPFEQPSITETYVSQFRDVPIPAPMTTVPSETLVTVAPDGSKFGLESFTGRVESTSLANIMMQNMSRQGWQLRGSSIGVRSIQLYEKAPHYAALFFREGVMKTTMDVWVINGVNVDILSLVPGVSSSVDSGMGLGSGSSSYSSPSSNQVTRLSE